MTLDRRALLAGGVLASATLSAAAVSAAEAQAPAPAAAPPVTRAIAHYVHAAKFEDLPANVRKEAARTFLNWMGVAVGGSGHEAVSAAITALTPFSGKPEASILGRNEKLDILNAALINGISSHVFDFDDTHLKTIIHPAGPVASAILALAQNRPISGRDFLHALTLGVEVECRIGNAIYPSHYDMGWHITGSCGVFGAAVAVGKLLGLSEQQLVWAIGNAASQPVGVKVQFGSMTKSFHPGRAAQNGMTSALLAQQGFTASDVALEGKDGYVQAMSKAVKWNEITDDLGTRYEAALNTYKPFACGIVSHPGIDAAIQLRNQYKLKPEQIAAIELHANPLVLSLMGKTDPQIGLEAKFSIFHCVAVGLIYGAAGEHQFSDEAARDPIIVALRNKVTVRADAAVNTQKSDVTIKLKNGRTLTKHIENAVGSVENPLSDKQLEAKFMDLSDGVLPAAQARNLMALCWDVEKQADAGSIALAAQTAR